MAESPRKKILMFGYLPPPYFGPSVNYQALLRSEFTQQFEVTFIDLTLISRLLDLEKVNLTKGIKFITFLVKELWYLSTRRFDFCCAPVSVNRNAFLKDAALLGLARLFGVPTVVYAHGNNLPDFYQKSASWVRRVIDHTFRQAAGAIVLGERLRFNFDAWLPPERILVVPCGIMTETSLIERPAKTKTAKVLYLGNMIREKGVFVLLEAAQIISQRRSDVQFIFSGAWWSTADEVKFTCLIKENNLQKQITCTGPVKGIQKTQLLAEADILAFPTFYYYETMGLVLLEAMQAGLAIVTTRRASIPEIIQDGVNGLLVEEQNTADLAEKILRIVDDPVLREQMGCANRERFSKYYTHEQYGRRMIEVFERLSSMRQTQKP